MTGKQRAATQTVDVGALLDGGAWSTYQKLLTALVAVAVIFDGFDIQILGFAIPSLMKEWHAARPEFGYVLALGLAGMTLGGPIGGYCGDRFGRRGSLIGSVALFGVATVATAFVNGFWGLSVLRFITGMGTGATLPNVSALVAEFAPLRRRSTAVKLSIVCVPLGGMLGGVMAAWLLPQFGWRGLYATGGAMPLACALALWALLPESPRFLARQTARRDELRRLLERMGHHVAEDAGFADAQERTVARSGSVRALFEEGLGRDTAGLWVTFLFCLGSVYLVFGWLPAMLTAQGLDVRTASFGLAAYNMGGVLGALVWTVLVTTLGSRGPLLSGALACAGSALALLLVPVQTQGDHTLLIACIGLNGLLANAVQTALYALATHVYPTSVRATGVAWAATLGRTGGLVSSLFGSYVIQAGHGAFWEALAMSMVVAFAGLAWVRSHFPAMEKEKN
jgi:AAHS family 4-hydroxybenzoate transporter-like MFS transporter